MRYIVIASTMIGRDPLSTLTLNANASSSSSASASSSSVFKLPAPPRKLAPIFIRHTRDRDPSQESVVGQPQPPSSSPDHHLLTPPSWHAGASGSGSGSSSSSSRKRVKLDHDVSPLAKARRRNENVPIDTGRGLEEDEDEEMTMGLGVESEAEMEMEVKRGRMGSMKHYFHASTTTTTPGRTARWGKDARQVDSRPCVPEEKQTRPTGIWRRPRRRFGMGAGAAGLGVDSMVDMIRMKRESSVGVTGYPVACAMLIGSRMFRACLPSVTCHFPAAISPRRPSILLLASFPSLANWTRSGFIPSAVCGLQLCRQEL